MTRAWLLVLACVLMLWQPLSFTGIASTTLPSIGMRGWLAVIELIWAGAVAAISAAAALSLWMERPHGVPLAKLALVLSTLRGIQSLYWTALPSNAPPGTQGLYTAAMVVFSLGWLAYLSNAERLEH
jgi:hypothetical protein